MISNEKKMAALISLLPVMMDFMEDIQEAYPKVYNKGVKKAGNDFIKEVERMADQLYRKMDGENDQELREFYNDIQNMALAFRQWLS